MKPFTTKAPLGAAEQHFHGPAQLNPVAEYFETHATYWKGIFNGAATMIGARDQKAVPSTSRISRAGLELTRRPGGNMAAFMALRGRRIVEGAGCLWHGVEARILMSLPYHLPQDPDSGELNEMLRSQHALGVRFPSSSRPGLPSGLYVCRHKDYDFQYVHKRSRSLVRRGLEAFTIRPAERSELLRQGLQLNRETMARQGRYDPEFGEQKSWERLVHAIDVSPAVVAYGAFHEGRLAAYAITCRDSGWLHLMHQMSRSEDLDLYPNHALNFTTMKIAAEDPALEGISFGLRSLIDGAGLHDYKLRMGYEFIERTCVFQLHPALAPVMLSSGVRQIVHRLRRMRPRDQRIEKFEAVLEGASCSKSGSAPRRIES